MLATQHAFWNGKGQLQDHEAHWEIASGKSRGSLVGRPYLRRRIVGFLARHLRDKTAEYRAEIVARTVDNDEWLWQRRHLVIHAVCWDAFMNSITGD